MKRTSLRFFAPLAILLLVPFIYNSCQKGLLGSKGFSAAAQSSVACKIEGGIVTKFNRVQKVLPAFAASKVRLRDDEPANGAFAKATGPVTLSADSELSVILDNTCLQENSQGIAQTVIAKAAMNSGAILPDLDRQAYAWKLDRDYTDTEIESLANQESCVVGVSWNKTYFTQSAFNDPALSTQTHLNAIHAESAYANFYAAPGGMAITGTPQTAVVLAAVDTGVDWQHPDLLNNMWAHSNGIGIDITTVGTALVDYNPFDISDIGHGTHISGLMAAVSNNAIGIMGTMPYRAKIMGIKIFKKDATTGNLSTTSQYFYNAIKFAYTNGAHVINVSLDSVTNGPAADPLAESALDEAIQSGSVVVVAVGNSNTGAGAEINGTTLSSIPAQFSIKPGVIGVGSFDTLTGNKSSFSHYSTTYAEIGAPGAEQGTTGIYSTVPRALQSYGRLAGTSQAAPIVSAAAGLTIGLIREYYGVTPSPAEVERLLLKSAVKSPSLITYFKDGNRLDLKTLVNLIHTEYPLTAKVGTVVAQPPVGCP